MDFSTSQAGFGSAAATPGVRVCARHSDVLAPRFCSGCGAPLCSACYRSRPHRQCPDCAVAEGKAPLVADLGWYVSLLIDGAVHAAGALPRRALPLVTLLTVGAALAFFALPGVGDAPSEMFEAVLLAFGAFSVAALLATWMQPALELPLRVLPTFSSRVGRAMVAGVVPFVVVVGALFALSGLVGLAFSIDETLGVVAAILVGMGGGFLVFFGLSAAVVPVQAAAALRRTPALRALRVPFSGGLVAYLQLAVTHLVIAMVVGSTAYGLLFPLVMLAAVAPIAGGVVFVALTLVGLCALLWLQATYGTASLRYLEDRARARSVPPGRAPRG